MLIVANWKAYVEDLEKAKELFTVSKKISRATECHIVLAPPAPFLGVLALKNKSAVAFAAQDISATIGGAATSETTARMYATAGATYAIIGHSERRAAGDTNMIVAGKLVHALACNLTPILCIGEQTRDREGRYLNYVREEITTALAGLAPKERSKIIFAYEPIWAIGKTAENAIRPGDLTEITLYIRKVLAELLPAHRSSHALVLYGGSVEPDNVLSLQEDSGIDGFLIGHASIDVQVFTTLVKQLS